MNCNQKSMICQEKENYLLTKSFVHYLIYIILVLILFIAGVLAYQRCMIKRYERI